MIDWVAIAIGLTGLITALGTIYNQRRQAKLAERESSTNYRIRQQELDNLEHTITLDIATRYQGLVEPLEAQIARIVAEFELCKQDLEEQIAENNQLKQTNLLYEQRIEFLEDALKTQQREQIRLHKQLLNQNRKLKDLEQAIKSEND